MENDSQSCEIKSNYKIIIYKFIFIVINVLVPNFKSIKGK